MEIYRSLEEVPHIKNLVLTQGTFDGVHTGHQKVLKSVVEKAKNIDGESMLLTFYPHPRLVLYPNDNSLRLLNTIGEKAEYVAEAGIDHMLVLPFTDEISKLSPLDFVRNVLAEKLQVKTIVVGYDHRFGKNREGSFHDLMEFGEMFDFSVEEIAANEIDTIAVSSTRIRKALLNGEITNANELLGRPYSLSGKVIHGKKLGREIGFPTANIEINDEHKLIPRNGVYVVESEIFGKKYRGAANIGYNPTIEGKGFSIEAHFLGFNEEIYDIAIRLDLLDYIRPEQKFNNVEELSKKIQQDMEYAKSYSSTG